jgi:hypothetical protein
MVTIRVVIRDLRYLLAAACTRPAPLTDDRENLKVGTNERWGINDIVGEPPPRKCLVVAIQADLSTIRRGQPLGAGQALNRPVISNDNELPEEGNCRIQCIPVHSSTF